MKNVCAVSKAWISRRCHAVFGTLAVWTTQPAFQFSTLLFGLREHVIPMSGCGVMGQKGMKVEGAVVPVDADFGRFGAALVYPANGEHDWRIDPFPLFAVGVDQPGHESRNIALPQYLPVFRVDLRVVFEKKFPIPRKIRIPPTLTYRICIKGVRAIFAITASGR